MTLEQIRIFLAVADLCHVTRAAERLGLTQSAVSAAISTLERQYDVRLFDRVGRGIVLTEEGRVMIGAARALMNEAETVRLTLMDLAQETRGHLRIAASQTIASYWLPRYLARMHDLHPKVDLTLRQGNTEEAARAVLEGSADLGFAEGDLPPSDLRQRVLARDELVLILPRDHPLARKSRLTAADYRGLRWLMRETGSGTRTVMEAHLAAMGLAETDLDVILELPSNEAILNAIRAGSSASMLSWRAVRQSRTSGLALRRIAWAPRPRRDFRVLSHPDRHRTRAAAAFLDLLAAG